MPEPTPEPDKGPFTSTEVKTIKISGPIEITLTTTYNSSHVPPTTTKVAGTDAFYDAIKPLAEIIIAKLDEIRRGQDDYARD